MRRPAKLLLLALIAALLPLRGIAALMTGSCNPAEMQIAAVQSIADAQDSHSGPGKVDTHCPGAVFLPAAAPAAFAAPSHERGIALVERGRRAFFPDKLDRPPLALHR